MITYLDGDATIPTGEGPRILAHVCNDRGGWGKGFVLELSKRHPQPEAWYRHWFKAAEGGGRFHLGAVQFVPIRLSKEPLVTVFWVANMIAQCGYSGAGRTALKYDALEECLGKVAEFGREHGASVHMPRIGTGLAGGDWRKIGPIVERALSGLEVFVYKKS